jgi:hypothetical protein
MTVAREMYNQSAEHLGIYTEGWKTTGLSLEMVEELPMETGTGNIGLSGNLPMITGGGYNGYAGEGHREPYPYLDAPNHTEEAQALPSKAKAESGNRKVYVLMTPSIVDQADKAEDHPEC